MTVIVDYGAGNLRSVQNTLDELAAEYVVSDEPELIKRAGKLILPGVGCFGQIVRELESRNIRDLLVERIRGGVPFLGICVGLQYLFEGSEESPGRNGLGIFPGRVKRFVGDARIPHMGWNSLLALKGSRLVEGLADGTFMYFAHSYYAPVTSATVATCTYIHPYSAVLEQENVYAVQFHPEKSGAAGLQVMKNFIDL